jgi:hypothetical protein
MSWDRPIKRVNTGRKAGAALDANYPQAWVTLEKEGQRSRRMERARGSYKEGVGSSVCAVAWRSSPLPIFQGWPDNKHLFVFVMIEEARKYFATSVHTRSMWLWGHSLFKITSPGPVYQGTKWLLWRPHIQSPKFHSKCVINKGLIKGEAQ